MKPITECHQPECDAPANFRYTWPGRDEAGICLPCAVSVKALADAIGHPLHLIPLTMDDYVRAAREAATPKDSE